ncbi:uncharacterized protein LOC124135900 [Haliotis rufescens]|uniref:uncharacterized protein LOC124135900 n=1 Tax=Haliotis rufescens TaxID=6454 RepID=UPI00201E879E|nr:uncharacterized protein LOC124135900 [Haliotis rufescens]
MKSAILSVTILRQKPERITGQDSVVVELLSQVTCSNKSVETVNQACLDVYNIPIQIPSPPTLAEATPEDALLIIENFIVDESDTLCSNQENYTKAVACLYYVNKKCNSVSAQDNSIYPAESDFQQQMTQSCDAIASITGGDNHAVEVTATCTLNTVGTTIAQLSQQCMNLNSVQEQLSDAASLSGAASADIVMDYVNLLIQKDSKTMCSSTDATLKATTCLYAVIYKCRFGGSFIKTVPTQNETRMGLAATCSIVESIVTVTPEIEALTTNLLCSNQTAVLAAQQQCLSMHNLPLNIQNPQSLTTGDHNAVIAANTLLISNTVLVCQ